EVVDDGDRAHVHRDGDDVAAAATLGGGRELLVVEVGVRAGERGAAGDELLTSAARSDRVVVDGHIGVLGLEALLPGVHGGLLRAGAGAVEGAAQRRAGGALVAGGVRLVGGAAGGQADEQGGAGSGGGPGAHGRAVHGVPSH